MRIQNALAAVALVATLSAPCSAQSGTAGASIGNSCVSCVITITPALTIDGVDAGSRTTDFSEVYRLSSGRFVVGSLADGWHAIFAPDGRFVLRFGGDVKRPQDMPVVARVAGDAFDTLHVYDNLWERELVFSPSGILVRTRALPLTPFEALQLAQDRLLVHSRVSTPAGAGYPFHIVEPSGRISRSFGVDRPQVLPDGRYDDVRVMAPARDTAAFWSAWRNRYSIEKWTVDGRRLLSIQRNVPWFEPWIRAPDGPIRMVKPPPSFGGLWEDDRGLVWTLVRVPKFDWKPSGGRWRPGDEEDPTTVADGVAVFDSIIEVIEPRTSRVVATTRVQGPLGYFLPGGLVVGMSLRNGQPVIEISRVSLEERLESKRP